MLIRLLHTKEKIIVDTSFYYNNLKNDIAQYNGYTMYNIFFKKDEKLDVGIVIYFKLKDLDLNIEKSFKYNKYLLTINDYPLIFALECNFINVKLRDINILYELIKHKDVSYTDETVYFDNIKDFSNYKQILKGLNI